MNDEEGHLQDYVYIEERMGEQQNFDVTLELRPWQLN